MRLIPVKNEFPLGFHEALGRVVVAFGRVEYLLKLCVKTLSGKDFAQGMLQAESTGQFWNLCKKAKSLADSNLPKADALAFSNLVDRALTLARERNDNIHALWTVNDDGVSSRLRLFLDKKTKLLESRGRSVTREELIGHEAEMDRLFHELMDARKKWRAPTD